MILYNKLNLYSIFLFLTVILFSCSGTVEERMVQYAQSYNTGAGSIRIPNLKYTKATPLKGNILKLEFGFSIPNSPADIAFDKKLYQAMSPAMVQQMCRADKKLARLVKDGMKVRIVLKNREGDLLSKMDIDQNAILKINDQIEEQGSNVGGSSNQELNNLVSALQSSLPLLDEETGIEITGISADSDNYLVYTAKVPNEMEADFLAEGSSDILKAELASEPQIRATFPNLAKKGVRGIRYIYKNQKDEELVKVKVEAREILYPGVYQD